MTSIKNLMKLYTHCREHVTLQLFANLKSNDHAVSNLCRKKHLFNCRFIVLCFMIDSVHKITVHQQHETWMIAMYSSVFNFLLNCWIICVLNLQISSPFVEPYLQRATQYEPDNLQMMDLLWMFHEKSRNFPAASRILSKLAERRTWDICISLESVWVHKTGFSTYHIPSDLSACEKSKGACTRDTYKLIPQQLT